MNIVQSLKWPTLGTFIILLTFGPVLARAAEPEPVAPEAAGKADPALQDENHGRRSIVAELEVNQAELGTEGALGIDEAITLPVLKPMTVEVNAVLEQSRRQVAGLQDRFDKEPNPEAALNLARQIEQLKINAELDILRIQVRYAETAGDTELASRLEAAVTEMTTPRPRKQPIERPAPDAGNR